MLNLFIMRHGQTILNKFDRIQGWADSPLTFEGEAQSIAGGQTVAEIHFDAVYTSDTQRTIKTAEKALSVNENGAQMVHFSMPELREFYFGEFEGLEAQPVWREVYKSIGHRENDFAELLDTFALLDQSETAEDYQRFTDRIEQGLDAIIKKHEPTDGETVNILVVSHALTINHILQYLVPTITEFFIGENGSIRKIVVENGNFSLVP